jgi:alpha-beta hydrolase superfamily lysophospholipase
MMITVNEHDVYCYTNSREIDPAKPSIVFIHGSGMDHCVWTLASRHFARHGNNVISVDLPGHGRSGGAPLSAIEAMADWVIAVLDTLNIEQAALVGHSLGSLIALESCLPRMPVASGPLRWSARPRPCRFQTPFLMPLRPMTIRPSTCSPNGGLVSDTNSAVTAAQVFG